MWTVWFVIPSNYFENMLLLIVIDRPERVVLKNDKFVSAISSIGCVHIQRPDQGCSQKYMLSRSVPALYLVVSCRTERWHTLLPF